MSKLTRSARRSTPPARIAARAEGGEVLVSEVVRLLTGAAAPVSFVDRGRCRLRGFTERWHLWAVEAGVENHRRPTTIGRPVELAVLEDLVVSIAAGEGRVVLVEGEAGIGKTHLVGEALARAARADIKVVEVAADEVVRRPGAIAHGLVAAAPDRLIARARLAGLLEVDPRRLASGEDLGYAVIEASVDLVEELARSTAVAARDGGLALGRRPVGEGADRHRGTGRCVRASAYWPRSGRRLARRRSTDSSSVSGKPPPPVCASARSVRSTCRRWPARSPGAAPGERLRRRLEGTGGNPLYVTELLRSMDDDGALRVDAGIVEVITDDRAVRPARDTRPALVLAPDRDQRGDADRQPPRRRIHAARRRHDHRAQRARRRRGPPRRLARRPRRG